MCEVSIMCKLSHNNVYYCPPQVLSIPITIFDNNSPDARCQATNFICKVLKGMNIVKVVQTRKGRKAKQYGTKMVLAVKDQQANMSKEADLLHKVGASILAKIELTLCCSGDCELWDSYTNTVHTGYEGPSEDEFTLDFGQGFITSLWNKTSTQRLAKIFLEKRAAGLGGSLANVMEEYVKGELYGQLQRSQQEWV
ncbi:hypothetical protein B0H14DRAFT_2596201 [Mycena olivaceomarginata]|nr:hypothetical protein B0H14DRAFT_2596201 [Mycena olivaceomarginata]